MRVACAEDGPYSREAREFLAACDLIKERSEAYGFRCQLALSLFHLVERLEVKEGNPVPAFRDAIVRGAEAVRAISKIVGGVEMAARAEGGGDPTSVTAEHYGRLFADFSGFHYFDEPVRLLRQRLERNGFPLGGKGIALDAGCGNGRYTMALRKLGHQHVIGVDLSELNIQNARRRLEEADLSGIEYRKGNVLDLPVDDGSCSFVFSNGVLHHTGDIPRGVAEIGRVLRPGGVTYLKLIPNPGGMHWDAIELLRHLMRDVPLDVVRGFFTLAGVPANRRYYILDHIMVPINERMTAAECERIIRGAGFADFTRCTRGADIDRLEQLHRDVPYAYEKYGAGVNLYLLRK